jgi:hypothetical protein
MVAGGEQDVRSTQCEAIQRGLRPGANGGVVDPAGWLMEDGDEGNAETAHSQGRACERSSDGVEQDGAWTELLSPTKDGWPAKSGERERPLGKREEADPRLVRWCRVRHSLVIEIATAQSAGIAECDQRENEMQMVHVAPTLFGPACIAAYSELVGSGAL